LIETHGADVNAQAKHKNTPLHNALSFFNPKNGDDITVLYYLLSQKGVNANIKGEYGHNLLHTACNNINALPFDVFKLLIETHGADVNAQNDIKDTPLHCAVRRFNPDVGGNITTLTYLLTQKGINGNIKGQYSCTLLHEACENIKRLPLDVFKLLIETISCNVNAQDNNNDTPLHRALCYFKPHNDDISVLQYLSNQTNTKGKRDDTLLHYACEKINKLSLDVFKLLIEKHGCDVNAQNNNNDTPIHLAFRCFDPNDGGDITVLTYLINQPKVHVNIKGKDGNTILHYACEKIHDLPLEIFKLLIGTHGADVNIQDNKKDTPSHNAFSSFDPNYDDHLVPVLLYLLSQKNIDVNIKDKNGHTLLHLACICEIGYDDDDDDEDDEDDDDEDDEDDEDDSDEDLEDSVIEDIQNQKADANLCEIVEVIAERCLEQIFDEITI
jgi:ankyrin repeat protein